MILLYRYIYKILSLSIIFLLLCSQLWAGIVISIDQKEFTYDDIDTSITWSLGYYFPANKLCQNIRPIDVNYELCIFKKNSPVFIISVRAISLSINENSTWYNPEKTAFIVQIISTYENNCNNMSTLFVFRNNSDITSGIYAFKFPKYSRKRNILNYEYTYKNLTLSDAKIKLSKESCKNLLNLITHSSHSRVASKTCNSDKFFCFCESCVSSIDARIEIEAIFDVRIAFSANYTEL